MVEEADKLQYLVKQYDTYKDHRKKNHDPRLLDNYKLFKSYRDNKPQIWQTNVFIPYAFSIIETIFPRVMEYTYQGNQLFKAIPREPSDMRHAEIIDKLMKYQVDTQIENMFLEQAEVYKSCLIQGTAIGKLTWDVYNNKPAFAAVDIFDFYPQPFRKYLNKMDGCYHVYDKFVDILQNWEKQGGSGYKNTEKLKGIKQSKQNEQPQIAKSQLTGKDQRITQQRDTALIYEYWGKVPIQESMEVGTGFSSTTFKEELVEIANRNTIIREVDNPYASPWDPDGFNPFVKALDYPDPGEFYGIGDIDNLRDLIREGVEQNNQFNDNLKLILNRMWIVGNNAGIDMSTVSSYPGAVIQADDIKQIEPVKNQDVPQSYFKAQEDREQRMDKASGVFDYTRGGNAPGMTDTVGGITSLIEEANMRFSLKIKILQMSYQSDLATKLFKLSKLFVGAALPIRIGDDSDAEWVTIRPDNLGGMYDFKPVGVTMLGNKLAKQNTMIRLGEVISKLPPNPPLADQILKSFDIQDRESIMQFLQAMWGMTQQAGAPVGGPGGIPLRQAGPPGAGGIPPGGVR